MKTLLISLLLVSSAAANSFDQTGIRQAACSIQVVVPGQVIRGSGTLITPTLVLSAAHVFERRGAVTVRFGQQRRDATLLVSNDDMDVAVLRLSAAPFGISPLPLAKTPPPVGAQVEVWGFGPTVFRSFDGTVVPATSDGRIYFGVQGEYGQATVAGDSGGAVVYNNTLVGVHWGYRTPGRLSLIHAARCDVIREWLVRTHN